MRGLRRYARMLLGLLSVLWSLTGCVLEYPDPDGVIVLNLDFSTELPPYKELIYENGSVHTKNGTRTTEFKDCDIRYRVDLYPVSSIGSDVRGREPLYRFVFTKPGTEELNFTTSVAVTPDDYRVLVWTDYVESGSQEDRYYDTHDFEAITLMKPHVGNDDTRDAFRGDVAVSVKSMRESVADVKMERPMGKFKFIATDYDKFLTKVEAMAKEKAEAEAKGGVEKSVQTKAGGYKIRFVYPGYMPHVFDNFANCPADSDVGRYFESEIVALSGEEAELGFDYVFTNGHEGKVQVALQVLNEENDVIGQSSTIIVPMIRSHLTVVRGDFLTATSTSGIGLVMEFEGEITIVI